MTQSRPINDHLMKFVWRRRHEKDLWTAALSAINEDKFI